MKTVPSAPERDGVIGEQPGKPSPERDWRRLRTLAIVAAIGLVALVIIAAVVISRLRTPSGIEASGTIEATQADVGPKVMGRLVQLRVRDGDRVRAGSVVAVLERRDPTLNLDQARAAVATAQAQVAVARSAYDLQLETYRNTLAQAQSGMHIAGSRVSQANENLGLQARSVEVGLEQAQAQLHAARSERAAAAATLERNRADYERARSLTSTGDMAVATLDAARMAYVSAREKLASDEASVRQAEAAVTLARENARTVEIRRLDVAASQAQAEQSLTSVRSAQSDWSLVQERRAQVDAATNALAQARSAYALAASQVDETMIRAPFDGVVLSHNVEVGDLVSVGSAVMTIGDLQHPYIRVYVGETQLPRIKPGQRARVTVDGLPDRVFIGTVTEISNTAEFTPSNVQTKEQRVELVFGVKIVFTDRTGLLKPGLPADAVIETTD